MPKKDQKHEIKSRPEFNFFQTDKFPLLCTVVDNEGIMLSVYGSDTLAFCPAVGLFLRISAEIWEANLGSPYLSLANSRRMIWAELDGKVVAGICWEYEEESKVGALILGFVDSEYRRRGIYTRLHRVFEDEVRRIGGVRVYAQVHADSTAQINSLSKVGLTPYYYRLQQWIND
jgi:GNAT superfamily N-acetyltransferase